MFSRSTARYQRRVDAALKASAILNQLWARAQAWGVASPETHRAVDLLKIARRHPVLAPLAAQYDAVTGA